ncbi:MAG: hypothetical protein ACR2JC_07585 [Chloroflexota bacterium]|nr:MAG: hypothetical protein DLM70_03605 [Chloroflexota bacterium]
MNEENWYRQLLALVLLSAARGAVEFITNPGSRNEAGNQMKDAFASIDYDAAAKAIASAIDNLAEGSKGRLNDTIDQLRDVSLDKVDDAKSKAQKQLGQKKSRKAPFLVALVLGGVIAYFFMDEQRRDDLLDRLTGASGPIEQSGPSVYNHSSTASHPVSDSPSSTSDSPDVNLP